MDSYSYSYPYPYHRNQMLSVPYYCPSGEIGRPHLKVDPARSMVPCEFWPFQFGGNQGGYAYPEFHGCYYQPQPSCYAFRPPYPYAAAPHHCHGTYPGFYPVHYVPPPPYFSTDQPRYEFEKNLPTTEQHHCCGCPDHPCKQSDKKSVKIVEHDDEDIDRKNADEATMVPINAPPNHPYPVVWLPYGGDMRREHTKPYKSEHEEAYQAKPSRDLESSEQPNLRNGWPLLNMRRSQGMKKGEDCVQKKQDDNSMSFPFPIFWMPYQPENTGKVERQESDFGQNPSPHQKLASHIESMHKDEDDKTNNSMQNEVNVKKIIPVKQLEENDMKKGTSDENGAKKLSSPKKPSKLAPVCLRVDPLPRKKGSSRSPSPPGAKGKSQDMPKDKPPASLNGETSERKCPVTSGLPDRASEVEERKCRTKTTKVTEGTTQGDELKDLNVGCTNSTSPSDNQIGNGGVEAPFEPEKKCPGESIQCDNTEAQTKKQLSEDEAAAVIQSAYRAYEVRKWEPLKKLKQIASVGEKVAEIRGHIQALEDSSDKHKVVDNKQKNVISETIMSLLLKLDTIQGLHPTVRDIRKSVARELVGLQEKLDSIPDSSPQVVTEQLLTAKHSEDTMRVHQHGDVTVMQGGHHDTNIMEQCEDQPLAVENSQNMVVNGQGGNNEQIDESQTTSKEWEVREISRQTEELTKCDVEKIGTTSKEMDGYVKDVVDLSQEAEHNVSKQMEEHDVKEVTENNTEFSQENISCCVEQQVTQTPLPCVLDEGSESTTQESLASAQTATTIQGIPDQMPQDEASRGLETEALIKESIDTGEQLLPVNSNSDNNMGCEDGNSCQSAAPKPYGYGISVEAEVENVGVLNEVATELLELNDNGRIEEHKEIHGSVKEETDEFSSTLQQEVITETDGTTTKVNEAEEVVEKTKGAVDDLKPRELELDDRKQVQVQEDNVAAESEESSVVNASGEVENIDWSQEEDIIVPIMSPTGSQISIQSEDRKVIEENEKLRKLLEKMIESGKEQLTTISALSGRVKQLERKLSRRNKLKKMRQCRAAQLKNDVSQLM